MMQFSSEVLNSPERILSELAKVKQEIRTLTVAESFLKDELEEHRKDGRIKGIFESFGVIATRVRREGKWTYSERLQRLEVEMTEELDDQKKTEREDGPARQNAPTFHWNIRNKSKDE